ncbi:MAG: asparagine synthase (glutamine-hydrolyzing) [Elusimicrobia bacterium]|nr:asparagine synthase (glutamine-hydrolyzing) [Elusimicrobiota bacterium]
MCGIVAIWSVKKPLDLEELRSYLPLIQHRGPDDQDAVLITPRLGFGHTRLSIIDLSPRGRQPKRDPQTGVIVTYNGEIYNYVELRRELEARGHRFESTSDTEVLLKAYVQWGPDCTKRFFGMFAFALWDPRSQSFFAARDRLGIKPLYWLFDGNRLMVGSELKIFAGYLKRAGGLRLNAEALPHYLTFRSIPTSSTLMEGVNRLGPGEYFLLQNVPGRPQSEKFWNLSDYAQERSVNESAALEELEKRLNTSIRRRLVADVPIGCFLSGGIDSSLVTLYAARLSNKKIHTFSVDFEEPRYSERRYFNFVAQEAQSEHHVFIMQPSQFLDFLPRWAHLMDDLVSDPSSLPFYFIALEARRCGVKVALSGEGADELFGGYSSYHQIIRWSWAGAWAKKLPALARFFLLNDDHRDLWRRLGNSHPFWGTAYVFSEKERGEVILKNTSLKSWHDLVYEKCRSLSKINQMLYFDMATRIPSDLLMRTDRATMAASLECRVPFLDHELVEFSMGLDHRLKIRGHEGKYILKELARKNFPGWFIDRPKIGFNVPLDRWFSHELKPLLERTFFQEKAIGALNYNAIQKFVNDHFAGRMQGAKIWNLLALELWHKQWIRGQSADRIG